MAGAANEHQPRPLRLALLNSRYPALSHTFIQREVQALRDSGVEILPISVRRPTLAELGQGADDTETTRTVYLVDRPLRCMAAVAWCLLTSPVRSLRTLLASQSLSPDGCRARLRHLAYALEAPLLVRAMRRGRMDTVHVHMANNGAMVALLATVFDPRITYSLTIHGSAEFFDMARLRVREKAEGASFVRFVSDAGRAQVMAFTAPEAWERFQVIHCGVDPTVLVPPRAGSVDASHILGVGRLVAIKGFHILLRALKLLIDEGGPWRLRIAGDGPDRELLERTARVLGIENRVEFLGPLAPGMVQAELKQAGALVVSSFMEGVPVVLMEAMAMGVPVVSTRVGGVGELVEDGVSGLLVRPGSAKDLAAALSALRADPASAARRAEAARRRIESDFDVRESARALRALLEQRGAPRSASHRS